ncbi:hypothetical protein FJZ28_05535, partial [Candidatus Peregrinibacteria bacterium]|nr:hypothetical protein [Candidatus Peregrinibacteria bacterium]
MRRRRRSTSKRRKSSGAGLGLSPETERLIGGTVQITAGILLLLALREQAGMVGDRL